MIDVVLVHPEIPPNTGNVIRMCANTGARLHLVEPLGFDLSERQLKRAGLDYHDLAQVAVHADWAACRSALATAQRWFAFTTRGTVRFDTVRYAAGDVLVFGSETAGLPEAIRAEFDPAHCLRIPMRAANRSMNLSNSAAVAVFEVWRQFGYDGGN